MLIDDHDLEALRHAGERRLLLLTGTESWTITQAAMFWLPADLWLGHGPQPCDPIAINKAQQLLGHEYRHVIFNGFAGLHPDMLAACSGMVKAGGLLILLMPPLSDWETFADPDLQRYVSQPSQIHRCAPNFLLRLRRLLQQQDLHAHWDQSHGLRHWRLPELSPWLQIADESGCLSEAQREAVVAIEQCAHGHSGRPLVLTADRGRGKSSALGLAVGRLLRATGAKGYRVLLTAPSYATCSTLLRHAQNSSGATPHAQGLELGNNQLLFFSPERLLDEQPMADLLLIDEAAAIPTSLLSRLLMHYPRIVFATTLHGYEGSGQGFALRIQPELERLAPGWRTIHLPHPIRWSPSDPLEPQIAQLLLLDVESVTPQPSQTAQWRWITQAELATDEALLRQVFGLLLLAHYQTSPSDLRTLLDAPDLALLTAWENGVISGVALIVREGELERDLAEQIWLGRRRPKGQLLPQTLLTHAGYRQAGSFRYARIMRIAVHPSRQGQGLGQQLLQQAEIWAREQRIDFIGAAFGATPTLLHFWQQQTYQAVRLGLSRDAASGCHSIILLKAIDPELSPLLAHWQQQLHATLPCYLPRHWRHLPCELVCQLMSNQRSDAELSPQTLLDLQTVAHGLRSPDHALPALQTWLYQAPAQWLSLPEADRRLLIRWLWQGWSWEELAQESGLAGQKALIARLRQILKACGIPELGS